MDAQENAHWRVVHIVAEERRLDRIYEYSQNTTLHEIMNTWIEECGQSGYWVFTSPDGQNKYLDFMTLEMIDTSALNSGIVNLRVKLLEEPIIEPRPTSEIFGLVDDECRCIEVEPDQYLHEVLRSMPGRPRELEHNGILLNLEETVDEAGMKNNDIVQEHRRQISVNVKLSSGETRIFQVAENGVVLDLFEKVKKYETEDFSLTHQGRHLHMQDKVRDLKQVVEVSMAQFVVDIFGQRVSWTTHSAPTPYPHFLSQLSFHGQLDIEDMEKMEFCCNGCGRCIFKSEDVQLLPVQCCRERSLRLTAKLHTNTRTLEDMQDILARIQCLLEQIQEQGETKLPIEVPRALCKDVYESLDSYGLIYNAIITLVYKVKKYIVRLEDEIKDVKKENDSLKAKNLSMEQESRNLKEKNLTSKKEAITLKSLISNHERNIDVFQKVVRCLHENTGVKLFVYYNPREFSPVVSRPEIQHLASYRWTFVSHIKCVVPELQSGWATFWTVRYVLQHLFSGDVIREIHQKRGRVNGNDVAEVTRLADDEDPRDWKQEVFCDADGQQVTSLEVEKQLKWQHIREGGRVLLSGGQCRTVLEIFPF